MTRTAIEPKLRTSFEDVFEAISRQPNKRSPQLVTTGKLGKPGVPFVAEAKNAQDGRPFISLPHNNRIYENDWGFRTNSMGNDGQRIGQYAIPLDQWCSRSIEGNAI